MKPNKAPGEQGGSAPFQAIEQSCVVVGSLNPGIFQPPWLVKNVKESCGDLSDWEGEFSLPELAVAFRNKVLRWQCGHGRLVVSALSPEGRPGLAVSRALKVLLHTPILAVGNNFNFVIEPERGASLARFLRPSLFEKLERQNLKAGAYSTSIQLPRGNALLGVTCEVVGEVLVKVSFNMHRDTTDSTRAAEAAALWDEDRASALDLLKEIVG